MLSPTKKAPPGRFAYSRLTCARNRVRLPRLGFIKQLSPNQIGPRSLQFCHRGLARLGIVGDERRSSFEVIHSPEPIAFGSLIDATDHALSFERAVMVRTETFGRTEG